MKSNTQSQLNIRITSIDSELAESKLRLSLLRGIKHIFKRITLRAIISELELHLRQAKFNLAVVTAFREMSENNANE